ncbi:MAG TPA: sodium:solute symporter [Opitutaceae bacterium]|nr:sodium:solute symporter [Opitutaceae bacterium]
MNTLDYIVLLGTLVGIASFGMWRTRGQRDLRTYVHGAGNTRWLTIGLAVMATQASAITFLSTPGQGYESGVGFVQNYFGAPLALLIIAIVFLPIFRRLKVDTAYEYLEDRFDLKTRVLGAVLFLIQRGFGAGITIYAPAIVLSTVLGWRLDVTIITSGLLVTAYTVTGGSAAVNLTQKYQIGVIFAGMLAAFVVLVMKLPAWLSFHDALTIAGGLHKLQAVDFSLDPDRRYTIWSGLFGGLFLALAYFGTDQSQVQRYLSGASLRESRLGLMFNAVFKIPMQFFILLLGALIFVFYQFERPPVFFNTTAWSEHASGPEAARMRTAEADFAAAHAEKKRDVTRWIEALHRHDAGAAAAARAAALTADNRSEAARDEARRALQAADPRAPTNDADYVFITFILDYLPHGLIGLLVTAFFAAALNSKSAELNALGASSTVDIYRRIIRRDASDEECVRASKWLTALWGILAIGFALSVTLAENLIQWSNIVGSIFYGVLLGLFLVAFFLKHVGGTAIFWAAIGAQALVFVLYAILPISYLYYNIIGCGACALFALLLQAVIEWRGPGSRPTAAPPGALAR